MTWVRLFRAWARLAAQGAVVRLPRRPITDTEAGALLEHEERRLRVLEEGRAVGWHPRASA